MIYRTNFCSACLDKISQKHLLSGLAFSVLVIVSCFRFVELIILHMVEKFYDQWLRNEILAVRIFMWFSKGKNGAIWNLTKLPFFFPHYSCSVLVLQIFLVHFSHLTLQQVRFFKFWKPHLWSVSRLRLADNMPFKYFSLTYYTKHHMERDSHLYIFSMKLVGSFSRSAVSHESGAKTGLSGIITGIIMGCALLFLTPLFEFIPQVMNVFLDYRAMFIVQSAFFLCFFISTMCCHV